jgi:hypothetical protein
MFQEYSHCPRNSKKNHQCVIHSRVLDIKAHSVANFLKNFPSPTIQTSQSEKALGKIADASAVPLAKAEVRKNGREKMRRRDRYDPDSDPLNPFYGRRGRDGRRGPADLYMQRGFPQNPRAGPRLMPGGPYGGLSPRNPDPRMNLMNPYRRMNPMNGYQPPPPMDDVKKWILETCGGNLEEATGSMKIRHFPDEIPQFVVHKPTMKLQTAFKDRKSKKRSGSRLMFHGTPLSNLQPILQGGFKGGHDGAVWIAREPSTSLMYALKGMFTMFADEGGSRAAELEDVLRVPLVRALQPLANLVNSPYAAYGALLGCEYVETRGSVGKGWLPRSGEDKEATSTRDHRAVMVRYVFLLPPQTREGRGCVEYMRRMTAGPRLPLRSQIKTQMIGKMENIEARIEGRRLEQ